MQAKTKTHTISLIYWGTSQDILQPVVQINKTASPEADEQIRNLEIECETENVKSKLTIQSLSTRFF
jgi:hypothetical protein